MKAGWKEKVYRVRGEKKAKSKGSNRKKSKDVCKDGKRKGGKRKVRLCIVIEERRGK